MPQIQSNSNLQTATNDMGRAREGAQGAFAGLAKTSGPLVSKGADKIKEEKKEKPKQEPTPTANGATRPAISETASKTAMGGFGI